MAFRLALVFYLAWGMLYVFRTSLDVDGSRVFVLWDDAMVSMRYARNLAAGHGLVWNAGAERVQGYTNLGVTLLMAAIHLAPVDANHTSLVFQLLNLFLLGTCAVLVRDVAWQLFDDDLCATVASMAFMVCGPVAILSLQGTDVGIITTLLLLALRQVVRATKAGGPWPDEVYLVLATGLLMRMDFAIVYATFGIASLAFPRSRRSVLVGTVTFALVLGGILAFQIGYYRDALPNTYYLKATGTPVRLMLESGWRQQFAWVERASVIVAISALGLRVLQPEDRRLWLLGAIPLALLIYDVRCGGDWIAQYTSRFFAPALPVLGLAAVGASHRIFEHLGFVAVSSAGNAPSPSLQPPQRRRALVYASATISALLLNSPRTIAEWFYPGAQTMHRDWNLENYRTALYLRDHTTADATVAVRWAGLIPYFVDRYAIDVLGKCDRHIAHLESQVFSPGHSKNDWSYLLNDRRPDFIQGDAFLCRRDDFVATYSGVKFDGMELYVRKASASKLRDSGNALVPLHLCRGDPDLESGDTAHL
jgi:arabinofuranosyltransferase